MADVVKDPGRLGSLNSRILLIVMISVFVVAVLISIAGTADDSDAGTEFTVDGIRYETTSASEVQVISNTYSGIVVIPSSVENGGKTYSVTSIGDDAFYQCLSLTSITIPNSVTSIGDDAFYQCLSLTSITIPNSVTSIGDDAFYRCMSMTSVTIGNSVASIGDDAFRECTSLTSITIPNSVTSIGDDTFSGCTSLTEIIVSSGNADYCSDNGVLFNKTKTELIQYPAGKSGAYAIPDGVTSIGDDAFRECTSLTSIAIPNSVTSIGNSAFRECTSLTSITIPNSVTSIGNFAFYGCTSLTSIAIPNSVTSIGNFAFCECTHMRSVTIGNGFTSIGDSAFSDCTSLTSVTVPNNVTYIGYGAFYGCTSLTEIIVSSGNADYCSDNGVLFNKTKTELIQYPAGKSGAYAIPDGVISIGDDAFRECTSLTSITIPNTVISIGHQAFWRCTSLTSITIPNSVTSIGYSAFYECIFLTSVSIPDGVTLIGDNAFSLCTSMAEITVSSGNVKYCSENGVLFNKTKTTLIQYPAGKPGAYTIPDSVTSIQYEAFCGCISLTSINIPNSVTSIGSSAFEGCTSLTEINVSSGNANYCSENGVLFNKTKTKLIQYPAGKTGEYTIPDSVTSIGDSAFSGCALTSVTIGSGITYISDQLFKGCTSLTSINIPNSVTYIGYEAFSGCTSLTSINIPNSVKYIGYGAFSGCTSLTSVTIPDSVTTIDQYAFSGCRSLTSINIPNSVKYIGHGAFSGCTALTSVTIPDSVTTIGQYAFSGCTSLTSVTIGSGVLSIGGYVFHECSQLRSIYIQGCKLNSCNTVLDKGLTFISIKEGSTGYSNMFSNYTFRTSDGTDIDRTDLAGYEYKADSEGIMIRIGGSDDPPSPASSGSIDLMPLYVTIAVAAVIVIGIIAVVMITRHKRNQYFMRYNGRPRAKENYYEVNGIRYYRVMPSDIPQDKVEEMAEILMSTTLYDIAVRLTDGIIISEDHVSELTEKGSFAQTAIGLMYLYGLGKMRQSDEDAFRLFKCASEGGQYYSSMALACLYATGRGTEKDIEEAIRWFRESENRSDGHFKMDDYL